MRIARGISLAVTGLILMGSTGLLAAVDAVIALSPEQTVGAVNPLIFGQNLTAANWSGKGHPKVYGQTGNGLWNPKLGEPVREAAALSRQMGIRLLRYPGGCMTHNFKWKETVGPAEQRPEYTFGLMEFMSFCRTIGAEPQICVSEYADSSQSAADLVEFLNAPATKDHPWALKRAEWGHPEPYGVRFFEMGNESYHGNHGDYIGIPILTLSPEQYGNWFNTSVALMKRVDSAIKTGAVLNFHDHAWNATVIPQVKDSADFLIDHFYAGGFTDWKDEGIMVKNPDYLMRCCMASSVQLQSWINALKKDIKTYAGKDIPLCISEYNASLLNTKEPVLYRYSLGAALFSADSVRIFLQPENNVMIANYWCYFNGFWGTLHGPTDTNKRLPEAEWEKNPAFHLFKLWNEHFGRELIAIDVNSPVKEFEGGYLMPPCRSAENNDAPSPQPVPYTLDGQPGKGFAWSNDHGEIKLELKNFTGSEYPQIGSFNAEPGCTYRLSYEGKIIGSGQKELPMVLGLGLVDSRGWPQTGSAVSAEGLHKAVDWIPMAGKLITIPGCQKMSILFRLRGGKQPVNATVMIRNLKIEKISETLPPYPVVTATASVSADGKTIYLIVFNKDLTQTAKTVVDIKDQSAVAARIWTVTGPPTGTNTNGKKDVGLTVDGTAIAGVKSGGFVSELPPCSMNAIEIKRK